MLVVLVVLLLDMILSGTMLLLQFSAGRVRGSQRFVGVYPSASGVSLAPPRVAVWVLSVVPARRWRLGCDHRCPGFSRDHALCRLLSDVLVAPGYLLWALRLLVRALSSAVATCVGFPSEGALFAPLLWLSAARQA